MKKALIIGAGPAGLTAAYELLKQSKDTEVVVLEESNCIGGISKTVEYKGNRMDMGGHRFFSKDARVNEWWRAMLPMQGAPSKDDLVLEREIPLAEKGPDPESQDRVMLVRHRVSRILFNSKFFLYIFIGIDFSCVCSKIRVHRLFLHQDVQIQIFQVVQYHQLVHLLHLLLCILQFLCYLALLLLLLLHLV